MPSQMLQRWLQFFWTHTLMAKDNIHKSFYFISAIAGLLLMMLEISFYQRTVIPLKTLFFVTISSTLITFFIIKKDYNRTYQKKGFFFPLMQSFLSFGFIACYCFIALNYYFADNNAETKTISILTKHTIGTGNNRQPAIEINYDGFEKQLVFYVGQQAQINSSNYVMLTVRKGFFGYDIFSDIKLK